MAASRSREYELPPWLKDLPHGPTETLCWAIKNEINYPRRPELYKRLKAIEDAVRLLRREMADLVMSNLLLDGDPTFFNQNQTYHGLGDMAERAARICGRHPQRQGPEKLYPESATGPNAKELCALILMIAWRNHSGEWPKNTQAMREACEALWRTSGGRTVARGWGKDGLDSVAAWRANIRRARQYRAPHTAGRLIENFFTPAF